MALISGAIFFLYNVIIQKARPEILELRGETCCGLFGIYVNEDEDERPGILLHEKVHQYTGAPWVQLLIQSFTMGVAMLLGHGLLAAWGIQIILYISYMWIAEIVADIVPLVVYRGRYLSSLLTLYEKNLAPSCVGLKAVQIYMAVAAGYPPYRLAMLYLTTRRIK
jgi:hypothetical protein